MRFRIATDGRWSGGGKVVLRNLRFAESEHPDVLDPEGSIPLIPRNLVPRALLITGRFVYLPQNAAPWHAVGGTPREWARWRYLRTMSDIAALRTMGTVRISSSIPARRSDGQVLANVLDEDFETALDGAAEQREDLADAFVCVGSMWSYRNLPTLLRAFAGYRRRGGRLRLVIAGSPDVDKVYRTVKEAASGMDAVSVAASAPARPEVLRMFRSAHASIFPSLVETTSVMVLEGIATSPRLLISDIVGHREVAGSRVSEEAFFDPLDPSALTASLHAAEEAGPSSMESDISTPDGRARARAAWASALAGHLRRLGERA